MKWWPMTDIISMPMDLVNVGMHDVRTMQSDHDASNDMSYDDACAIARKVYNAGKEVGNKGPNGAGTCY